MDYLNYKKNEFYNDKEILTIQHNLIKMGFDLNMINKIIYYYNIKNENDIIDYLIKDENGFWNHPFIPMLQEEDSEGSADDSLISSNSLLNKNRIMNNVLSRMNSINTLKDKIPNREDICEICGESKQIHRIQYYNFNKNLTISQKENYILNKENLENKDKDIILNIDNDIYNFEQNNKIENENECPICLGEFENPIEIENCKHKFCEECFGSYINELITKNEIDKIPCPYKNCSNTSISEEFFSKYISEQTHFKYRQFKAQNEIARDPKKFFCPHCDSYAVIKDNLEKYDSNNPNYSKSTLKCQNGHEFCSCGRSLHKGACYKEDQAFKDLMKKENIKHCPKCGFLIKKNKGCNHITCGNPTCKYEFCWICMKESIPDHFKYGPCAGMQFIDPDSILFTIKNNYPKLYCIYSLLHCLFGCFFLILSLFILPSISFIYLSYHIIFDSSIRTKIIPRKYCIHIMYFTSISCIFVCLQSIIYMMWMFIFFIISCSIIKCILRCFLGTKKRTINNINEGDQIELENIN